MKHFSANMHGRLGTEPEPKQIGGSTAITFRLAVKNRKGDTTWVGVSCWGGNAEFARNYLKKKDKVFISGDLDLKPYINKDGNPEVYVNCSAKTLVAVGGPGDSDQNGNDTSGHKSDDWGSSRARRDDWGSNTKPKSGGDDPIPF